MGCEKIYGPGKILNNLNTMMQRTTKENDLRPSSSALSGFEQETMIPSFSLGLSDQSVNQLITSLYLPHRADETQQGRNSCPPFQFLAPSLDLMSTRVVFPLSYLRSISLVSLTTRPKASSVTRSSFLTPRPGAECGSCFTWGLFFQLVVLSVTRRRPPLGDFFFKFYYYYNVQNYLQRYTVYFIAYTSRTTYNTVQYYVFLHFCTHTTRKKGK